MNKRFFIVVMDSVGIGSLPDAHEYNSAESDTLGHIAEQTKLRLPNMQKLGLGNIATLKGIPAEISPAGAWGKMAELSAGMDTTTGHWEMAGLITKVKKPTFPNGFPPDLIREFETRIGRRILGNYAASGVKIIQDLGGEHMKTGFPIIYTSADSVFQIAAHEDIIPVEQLYEFCRIAREMLVDEWGVSRVIARPFIGDEVNGFTRTERRHDFSLIPPAGGLLEKCQNAGISVTSVGKIYDIFAGQNIDFKMHGTNNDQAVSALVECLRNSGDGFYFVNLVDFDMKYGHTNDTSGYKDALERFDCQLSEILSLVRDNDILVITADHGNDPTTESTDHSREYVPLLVYGRNVKPVNLGVRKTYADLGQTIADYFGIEPLAVGKSFLSEIMNAGER